MEAVRPRSYMLRRLPRHSGYRKPLQSWLSRGSTNHELKAPFAFPKPVLHTVRAYVKPGLQRVESSNSAGFVVGVDSPVGSRPFPW